MKRSHSKLVRTNSFTLAFRLCIVAALGLVPMMFAQDAQAAGDCPALPRKAVMPPDAVPASLYFPEWKTQVDTLQANLSHQDLASRHLVFVGDSLTFNWVGYPDIFKHYYGQRAPLNLGVWGDRTEGVLKRLDGEMVGLQPRLVVLLIGTNNTATGSRPENVALGVAEIVRLIHARSPTSRVLIVGILPRGLNPSPLRDANARVNELIAQCADGKTTFTADVGPALLNTAGQFTADISPDEVHLTSAGYTLLAQALRPIIDKLDSE